MEGNRKALALSAGGDFAAWRQGWKPARAETACGFGSRQPGAEGGRHCAALLSERNQNISEVIDRLLPFDGLAILRNGGTIQEHR